MILYYAILILYYYYSTNIQEEIIPQNFLWKFLKWMDEIFVFKQSLKILFYFSKS